MAEGSAPFTFYGRDLKDQTPGVYMGIGATRLDDSHFIYLFVKHLTRSGDKSVLVVPDYLAQYASLHSLGEFPKEVCNVAMMSAIIHGGTKIDNLPSERKRVVIIYGEETLCYFLREMKKVDFFETRPPTIFVLNEELEHGDTDTTWMFSELYTPEVFLRTEMHKWRKEFKLVMKTLFLCKLRDESPMSKVAKDVLWVIAEHLSEFYRFTYNK